MKRCTKCHQNKYEDEFYPNQNWCKPCKKANDAVYYRQRTHTHYGLQIGKNYIKQILWGVIVVTVDVREAKQYVTYANAVKAKNRWQQKSKKPISITLLPS